MCYAKTKHMNPCCEEYYADYVEIKQRCASFRTSYHSLKEAHDALLKRHAKLKKRKTKTVTICNDEALLLAEARVKAQDELITVMVGEFNDKVAQCNELKRDVENITLVNMKLLERLQRLGKAYQDVCAENEKYYEESQ